MRVDLFDFELPPGPDRAAAGAAARQRAAAGGRGRRDLRPSSARAARTCCGPATCWCSTTPRSSRRSSRARRGEASIGATLHKREGPREWQAFLRNAKRARVGDTIDFGERRRARRSSRRPTTARRCCISTATSRSSCCSSAPGGCRCRRTSRPSARPMRRTAPITRRCSRARRARSPRRPPRCISRRGCSRRSTRAASGARR